MKQIGEAAAKAAKHRKFHWCRRQNGFSDMPIWRVVALQLSLPLYQVLAFVNRLEELANAAEQRGHVGSFNPAEFGAALGMSTDDAARIFAALEDQAIGWVAFEFVATFYDRNPDKDDDSAAERKRRQRSRQRGMREIARAFAAGKINEAERRAAEAELLLDARLSTSLSGHNVTPRDIVTVTPEQNTVLSRGTVDNSGDVARGASEGLPDGAHGDGSNPLENPTRWLDSEGRQMLVNYLQISSGLAATYIERWRRDLLDDAALVAIILGADKTGFIGARFHTVITEQWRRHVATAQYGRELPLMPPRPGDRKATG